MPIDERTTDGSSTPRVHRLARRRLLAWIAPLCILACTLIACTTTAPTATVPSGTPSTAPLSSATPTAGPASSASPAIIPTPATPANGLVVTVLATDVGLWQGPDTQSGNVHVSFAINGNTIQTIVYVSGEVPVLEANILGTDGKTRWTPLQYSGYAGPLDGGTSFTVTGYLRNDFISAPHAPGAPAIRNP
jgi:hypothetical protein